ncbi:MAG: PIN domain-containing protein [Spirochaetales bacterium]|jgi:predicted nucleic acid-binding protein|nr:PIN domain-containing protein [Spirochaetales bacterium]
MELNLNSNSTIFFDTAPFIYYFEDNRDYVRLIDQLLSSIFENNSSFVTSYITYIELITKPKQLGRNDIVAKYRDYFTNSDNLSIYPLNLMVSEKVAEIKANYNFKTPDAIQIATAIICGADYIITNDKSWKKITEASVLILSEL